MSAVKNLLAALGHGPLSVPLTDEQVDVLVRDADEAQLYIAVMTSRPTKAQHDRLEARWREIRAAGGGK